jgi:hypothetical protein
VIPAGKRSAHLARLKQGGVLDVADETILRVDHLEVAARDAGMRRWLIEHRAPPKQEEPQSLRARL